MSEIAIDYIFKDPRTKHSLRLFSKKEIDTIQLFEKQGKAYLISLVTSKKIQAKPEEIIRQLFVRKLMEEYGYPKERLALEKGVWFGAGIHEKKADIVVFHKDLEHPYIIVEVKKPSRKDGIQQLKSYCNAEGSPIGVWTNGEETVVESIANSVLELLERPESKEMP